MLVVFSGLPGTGKTTISRELAIRLQAVHLRVDSIEQAIRDAGVADLDVGKGGYLAAQALARSNLELGNRVVVDCVNPLAESREAWRSVAKLTGVRCLDVELHCSDVVEHRHRVETRVIDIPRLRAPSWQSVLGHEYETWQSEPLRLDTAVMAIDEAVMTILAHLGDAPAS